MNPASAQPTPVGESGLSVRRQSGSIGALIGGVDLGAPLTPSCVAQIRAAFLAHGVVFFENQDLGPRELLEAARALGEPMCYPQLPGIPDYPLVTEVLKRETEREAFGGVWHSDTAYLARPPMATLLYAVEIPPQGGDTLFACQTRAFEALSPGLRAALRGLRAVNSSAKADVSRTREDRLRDSGAQMQKLEAEHPVVRTHPETGRQALYVSTAHTQRFCGWADDESAPLLGFLFAHQVRPEFTCRWRWTPGAVAIWDNRCVQHLPVNDYHGHRRRMLRVTLAGDEPV